MKFEHIETAYKLKNQLQDAKRTLTQAQVQPPIQTITISVSNSEKDGKTFADSQKLTSAVIRRKCAEEILKKEIDFLKGDLENIGVEIPDEAEEKVS